VLPCIVSGCTAVAHWSLWVSGEHLAYCNDHVSGAVKTLDRHGLHLDSLGKLPESWSRYTESLKETNFVTLGDGQMVFIDGPHESKGRASENALADERRFEWFERTLAVKEAAHWVTIRDHPVLIGGPAAGSGTTSGSSGGGATVRDPSKMTNEQIAHAIYVDSEQFEPKLAEFMRQFAEKNGGELEGLAHRLKSEASILSKINRNQTEYNLPPAEAAMTIADTVRYTVTFDKGTLVDKADDMQAQLAREGWQRYDHKWKNFFVSQGPYRGYNTIYQNAQGQRFELQFHTKESLRRKELSHSLYERYREMLYGPERDALERESAKVWDGFELPDDYRELKGEQIP
jgi:ppGpp synthetase/RelA/SpoT-type nucleotidyltranferase